MTLSYHISINARMQLIELSARFSKGGFLLLLRLVDARGRLAFNISARAAAFELLAITCLNVGGDCGWFRGVIYDADAGHIRWAGEPLLHSD